MVLHDVKGGFGRGLQNSLWSWDSSTMWHYIIGETYVGVGPRVAYWLTSDPEGEQGLQLRLIHLTKNKYIIKSFNEPLKKIPKPLLYTQNHTVINTIFN